MAKAGLEGTVFQETPVSSRLTAAVAKKNAAPPEGKYSLLTMQHSSDGTQYAFAFPAAGNSAKSDPVVVFAHDRVPDKIIADLKTAMPNAFTYFCKEMKKIVSPNGAEYELTAETRAALADYHRDVVALAFDPKEDKPVLEWLYAASDDIDDDDNNDDNNEDDADADADSTFSQNVDKPNTAAFADLVDASESQLAAPGGSPYPDLSDVKKGQKKGRKTPTTKRAAPKVVQSGTKYAEQPDIATVKFGDLHIAEHGDTVRAQMLVGGKKVDVKAADLYEIVGVNNMNADDAQRMIDEMDTRLPTQLRKKLSGIAAKKTQKSASAARKQQRAQSVPSVSDEERSAPPVSRKPSVKASPGPVTKTPAPQPTPSAAPKRTLDAHVTSTPKKRHTGVTPEVRPQSEPPVSIEGLLRMCGELAQKDLFSTFLKTADSRRADPDVDTRQMGMRAVYHADMQEVAMCVADALAGNNTRWQQIAPAERTVLLLMLRMTQFKFAQVQPAALPNPLEDW